jgi:ankyrin repeat protein
MFAVSQNDPEIVRMLLDRGADPRIRNSSGNSPLWAAIIVPDAAQRENANTNFIAAGDHYAEIVELLLDHGADANLISRDQGAPLHQAARAGGVELTRVLLAHGARAEIQGDDRGTTPLMLAAENAHPEIVKLLLAAGANANHRDTNGYTSLMQAIGRSDRYGQDYDIQSPDAARRIQSVRLLLDAGADPNPRDTYRSTALHYAARNGSSTITQLLIDHKADINARDDGSATPLLRAVASGHLACAETLLRDGADPNQKEFAQRTPLFVATHPYAGRKPDDRLVALLRRYGARD